jgi:hypothetical protein
VRRRAAQAQREALAGQLDARKPAPLGRQRGAGRGAERGELGALDAELPARGRKADPVRARGTLEALVDEPRVGGQQRGRRGGVDGLQRTAGPAQDGVYC